ncbi:hypothetical protein KKF84_06565 [Myxococcota bacterium]|nr:hypothetical protein [Myxococcota bacterium]
MANEIKEKNQATILSNVPKEFVEGMERGGGTGDYLNIEGSYYDSLIEMETSLKLVKTGIDNIGTIASLISVAVEKTKDEIDLTNLADELDDFRSMQSMLNSTAAALSSTANALSANPGKIAASIFHSGAATLHIIVVALEFEIMNIQNRISGKQIEIQLDGFLATYLNHVISMRQTVSGIEENLARVKKAMNRINSLKKAASSLAARATMSDTGDAGKVYNVNTVMRRRYNTNRLLYENQLKYAKKMAFLARRSLEFKLGVKLRDMNQDLYLVEKPSSWVDDLCSVTGIDYTQIRDASALTETNWFGEDDNYAHQYVGTYIDNLTNLMTSYGIDYPFHDGDDLAVISLKEDIIRPMGFCYDDSRNRLLFSGQLGQVDIQNTKGWSIVTQCDEESDDEKCIEIENRTESYASSVVDCDPSNRLCPQLISAPQRIMDAKGYWRYIERVGYTWITPGNTHSTSGYVAQITEPLERGRYLLSFWHKNVPNVDAPDFRVEVRDLFGNIMQSGNAFVVANPGGPNHLWTQESIPIDVGENESVEVRVYPSNLSVNGPQTEDFGDFLLWGMQLEGCEGDCTPTEYQRTYGELKAINQYCSNNDSEVFRSNFEEKCIDTSAGKRCYYEYVFPLNMDQVEKGTLIPSAAISGGNFNYRHSTVAINIVGTNVRQCFEGASSSCYTNAYVEYSLEHNGLVEIRNGLNSTQEFNLPNARISNAKAVTAEVVITNPMSSNHQSLLADKKKSEFRGRPLQGLYTLRIWKSDALQWYNIEDIQLIWNYRYWSKFNNNY